MRESVPAQYFIEQYKRVIDPWNYESSAYEREKYQATLEALTRVRYRSALELACSVGVFTSMLAERCDRVLAVDVSDEVLQRAARNCARHPHVRFERRVLPHEYPAGRFDLTTVCEVAFYLSMSDLLELRERVVRHCIPGAHVVLVHWTPPVRGHATSAQEVHEAFRASRDLRHMHGFTRETYRLDLFEVRPSGR